jgi:hypothetical protein
MNKKLIITIIAVIAIIGIVASIVAYFLSFHTVTFTFKKSDMQAVIYKADDTEMKNKVAENVKDNGTLHLQEGNYQAVPTGTKYATVSTYFSVNKSDSTVEISSSYSAEYLKSLFKEDLPAINNLITSRFSKVINGFTIQEGELYDEGQWYTTTLTQIPEDIRDEGDIYHIVLLKENGTWKVIGKPTLVLTKSEYKDVPITILQNANRQGDL